MRKICPKPGILILSIKIQCSRSSGGGGGGRGGPAVYMMGWGPTELYIANLKKYMSLKFYSQKIPVIKNTYRKNTLILMYSINDLKNM